jgi:type III secretion system low calcium response chaperone LcrH/SycD
MVKETKKVKHAVKEVGEQIGKEKKEEMEKITKDVLHKGLSPKSAMGLSDAMVEGMYGQGYRLYNNGKYKDSSEIFRLLIMLDPTDPRYTMGLAACMHMQKEYKAAINTYGLCGILDSKNPVPHYHASDCYVQMKDPFSAIISLEMAVKRAGDKAEFASLKDRALLTISSLKKQIGAIQKEEVRR